MIKSGVPNKTFITRSQIWAKKVYNFIPVDVINQRHICHLCLCCRCHRYDNNLGVFGNSNSRYLHHSWETLMRKTLLYRANVTLQNSNRNTWINLSYLTAPNLKSTQLSLLTILTQNNFKVQNMPRWTQRISSSTTEHCCSFHLTQFLLRFHLLTFFFFLFFSFLTFFPFFFDPFLHQ